MNIKEFKKSLLKNTQKYFPQKTIDAVEKRGIIIEARINIKENVFVEIYYNALNQKKSYALISHSKRIFGYDNYKYWHVHPFDKPSAHVQCNEPPMEEIFSKIENIAM